MRTRPITLAQRIWNPRTLLALGGLSVFVVGSGLINLSLRNRSIDADIARLQRDADTLETRNVELVELLKRFETSGFLEREARLKLNLQKPGETVVVVERGTAATGSVQVAPRRAPVSNAERWWRYFFDPSSLLASG